MALPKRGPGGIVRDLAERKFLTILFADIRNSTTIIRDLDPEDALAKLRPAVDMMIAAVREAGGMVNRVQGDGIMALFGAPVAVDDHALRACRAALLMRNRLAALGDSELAIRVGVHSGEVVAHFDAGDFAQTYDVTGPAAHFAARLEGEAQPGMALISDDTFRLVRGAVQARPRRGLSVKGFDRVVDAWELVGLGLRSRWLARQQAGLSPFVGRDAPLADLRSRLNLARAGTIQFLAIGGEPGTGKSRLLHELVGGEAAGAWDIWEADTDATTGRAPFAVLRRMLRIWLGVGEASTAHDVAVALHARMAAVRLPPAGMVALAALLNLEVVDAEWSEMDASARSRLIEATLVAVLDAAQRERPIILVIEDLHWADAESFDLLYGLAEKLPEARIAVVATHRPMDRSPQRGDHVLPITLSEFSLRAAERFLDALVGGDPSLREIKTRLLDTTGRVPFFLEEAVRHLRESGALVGPAGACIAAAGTFVVETPPSVQAVAAARIDSLESRLKALVRSASAIGRRFPRALLADVVGLEPEAFDAALRQLVHRQILFDAAGADEFIEFRHEILREAAYGAMLREHRQALHRSILAVIEKRYAARLRDWTEVLAYNAAQARLWERAVDYERRTIGSAMEASAYPAAVAACGRALDHLKHLPRTVRSIETEIDVLLTLRATVLPGSFARWVEHTSKALELAEEIGDTRRQLLAATLRAWALNFGGAPSEAVPAAEKALALARTTGAETAICTASIVVGQAHYVAGNFDRALEAFDFPLAWLVGDRRFTRAGTGTSLVVVQTLSAMAHAWKGDVDRARDMVERAAATAAETRRPYDLAIAEHAAGFVAFQQQRYEVAIGAFEGALARCRENELQGMMPLVLTYLGAALLGARRLAQADAVLEEARTVSDRQGFLGGRIAAASYLCGVRVLQGRAAEAVMLGEEACRQAGEFGFVAHHAVAVRFLLWSKLAAGTTDAEAVGELLKKGRALARACGAEPQARALEVLATHLGGICGRPEAKRPDAGLPSWGGDVLVA
jgi:class 3 adenylate cyclase/tetratricopeptide (TPR) repeat protein